MPVYQCSYYPCYLFIALLCVADPMTSFFNHMERVFAKFGSVLVHEHPQVVQLAAYR